MADVTQVYSVVNSACSQVKGLSNIAVTDTSSLVSLGDLVLSDSNLTNDFYGAFLSQIGKIVYRVQEYKAKEDGIIADDMEWGAILMKISREVFTDAVDNEDWKKSNYSTEYPKAPNQYVARDGFTRKLFKRIGVWEYDDVVMHDQLRLAFRSASEMNGYISAIYSSLYSNREFSMEVTKMMARNVAIAKATVEIPLVTDYNTAHSGATVTSTNCMENDNFITYMMKRIADTKSFMAIPSKSFNDGTITRWTNEEDLHIDILSIVKNAIPLYLTNKLFHTEGLNTSNWHDVPMWQGTKDSTGSYDLAQLGKIAVNVDGDEDEVTKTNVVCVLRDKEAVKSHFGKIRTATQTLPLSDRTVVSAKCEKGYAVDTSENIVVFTFN